jgi:hypothetical protein
VNLRTYALYCAELPERGAVLRAHLAERGVRASLVRSVHGRTWGLRTTREYEPGRTLPPGHVGLDLGFWFLCQHILLANPRDPDDAEHLLLEDDAVLPPDFWSQLGRLEAELAVACPDWDLVFLGMADREPHVWHKVSERLGPPDSRLCRLHDPFGTHALLVRRRALPVLLDRMAVAERNLDQQLWQRVLQPGLLRWCAVVPSLVLQRTCDHAGTGKPEWEPSCIHPSDDAPPAPALRADLAEVQRLAGFGRDAPPPERQPPEVIAASSLLTDPFPCIYRGEPFEEGGRLASGRPLPLFQCARLNVPCHVKVGDAKTRLGAPARECRSCELRTEMAASGPRPRLPIPDGHFNPSLAVWGGRLILATRDSWGHSKVALWELRNGLPDWTGEWAATPLGSHASAHPEAPRLEDPRLFVAADPASGQPHLHAMFNLPDGYPPRRVQVGYARFARDLSGVEATEVFRSPHGNLYEKNWAPFERHGELHWVYGTKPEHTVLGPAGYSTPNRLPWTGGVVRGGAAPVLVEPGEVPGSPHRNPVFYHFFHGCLKRLQGSVYTVGCAVFSASPPFEVLRQTPVPLLWPDLPAAGEDVTKRYVCWPGGAVLHAGAWFLAVGVDDTFSRIVRLPVADVEAALSDRPEDAAVASIRDTKIAHGIHESEKPR